MKIVVDGFGGDNAPLEIVKGCVKAVNEVQNLQIVLTGNQDKLLEVLNQEKYNNSQIQIINALEVIDNCEQPTVAIRQKADSSLVKGLEYLKANEDCIGFISAGSTGAILTGSFLKIGRIKGVSRPALCPTLPTLKGSPVCLIDCGANMDCKPINLAHFALMGSKYYQTVFGVENPRVAILNVGAEDEKGNDLVKTTFPILKSLPINFVGSVEARDFLSGNYDVVVADGFAGNVLLKSSEGAVLMVMKTLKSSIKSKFLSKIGALFMRKNFKKLKAEFDYSNYGGSPFLGVNKVVIKSHGSANANAIYKCILQAIKLGSSNIIEQVAGQVKDVKIDIVEE